MLADKICQVVVRPSDGKIVPNHLAMEENKNYHNVRHGHGQLAICTLATDSTKNRVFYNESWGFSVKIGGDWWRKKQSKNSMDSNVKTHLKCPPILPPPILPNLRSTNPLFLGHVLLHISDNTSRPERRGRIAEKNSGNNQDKQPCGLCFISENDLGIEGETSVSYFC